MKFKEEFQIEGSIVAEFRPINEDGAVNPWAKRVADQPSVTGSL